MQTYVVSFLSFFDNKMLMTKVESDKGPAEALKQGLFDILQEPDTDIALSACHTVEDVEEAMYDMDSAVGILEV